MGLFGPSKTERAAAAAEQRRVESVGLFDENGELCARNAG